MRFQQLKRDPNNIVRKRLVKSKKNWVVLSSLSIAGGLLFLSAPTYIAKADTTTETQSVTTTLTAKAAESSSSGTSTAANSETKPTATDSTSTEKQAASTVTTPTVTDGATSEKAESTTDTKTPATDAEASDTTANKATTTEETSTTEQTAPAADSTVKTTAETVPVDSQAAETADTGKVTTKTDDTKAVEDTKAADDTTPVKTDTTIKTDTDVPATSTTDSTTEDSGTTDPVTTDKDVTDVKATDADATKAADEIVQTPVATSLLMANLAESKLQLAKMGVMAESLALTPETEVLADGNIAEGFQGTAPWSIDAKGILHIGDSTKTTAFENNTATTTRQVSSESSSTSTSTETPTSPWDNYANNINTITFEGTVQGAKDMSYMFANLGNLTTINNIDNLDTNGVTDSSGDSTPTTNAKGMFMNDAKLTDIISARTPDGKASTSHTAGDYDLTNMHFGSLTDTSDMFLNNQSVKTITFPNTVDTKGNTLTHVSNFNYMFKNDISLTNVVMKNWQLINYGKTMIGMFQNDYNLTSLDLTSWLMPSTIETGDSSLGQGMFDGTNLQSIKLSNYNKFKSYTALPSSTSNGMAQSNDGSTVTSGGKTFATIPGNTNYTYDLSTITANSGSGTTFVANTAADKATPTTATMEIQTNMGVKTVSVSGTLYSAVTVDTPSESGFTADLPKVVGTITNSTTATTSNYVTYSADATKSSVSTTKGDQIIDIPAGVVGTTSDPIDLPTVGGYEPIQVKVEYTKDGNIITDVNGNVIDAANPIQYVGKPVNVVAPTLKDNSETLKVTTSTDTDTALTTAKVGDKVVVTLPTVTGYTPHDANGNEVKDTTITGTIDAGGNFVPDSGQVDPTTITYTGVKNAGQTLTVSSTGTKPVSATATIPDGNYDGGASHDVTFENVPTGYTAPEIKYKYGTDGKVKFYDKAGNKIAADAINLTGNPIAGTTVKIKDPTDPSKIIDVPIPGGNVGSAPQTVDINTKNHETGYTAPVLTVTYNDSGTLTITKADGTVVNSTDVLEYTGNTLNPGKVDFSTSAGLVSVNVSSGQVGKTKEITINKPGYEPVTLTATYNASGSTTYTDVSGNPVDPDTTIQLKGVTSSAIDIPVTLPDKTTTKWHFDSTQYDGKDTGDTSSFTNINGYVAPSVTQKFDENGNRYFVDDNGDKIDLTTPLTYTPKTLDKKTDLTVNIKTGNTTSTQTITVDPGGKMDATSEATLKHIDGYTTPTVKIKYVSDADGNVVPELVDKDGNPITDANPAVYTGKENPKSTVTVSGNGVSSEINIPAGNYGDSSFPLDIPDKAGYTHPTITVTYGPDGTPTFTDADGNPVKAEDIKYTGVKNDAQTLTVSSTGTKPVSTEVTIPEGNYDGGIKHALNITTPEGYTVPEGITYAYDPSGTAKLYDKDRNEIKSDSIKLTGNPIAGTTVQIKDPTDPTKTISVDIPKGNVGDDTKTIDVNKSDPRNGYTAPTLTVAYDTTGSLAIKADGKEINPTDVLSYTPKTLDKQTDLTITVKTGNTTSTQTITVDPGGKMDTTSDAILETIKGYTTPTVKIKYVSDADGNVVPEIVDANGKAITEDNPAVYTGKENPKSTVTVSGNGVSSELTIPAGNYGDSPFPLDIPDKAGYTHPTVTVTYGPDGTPTFTDADGKPVKAEDIKYTGIPYSKGKTTVDTPDGPKEVTVPASSVGQPVTIKVPDVPGYNHATTITGTLDSKGNFVSGTFDKDGNFTKDTKQNNGAYIGNPVTPKDATIAAPNGKTVTGTVTGGSKVGDKVTATVPNVDGYDHPTTITGTLGVDGSFIPDKPDQTIYTGRDMPGKDTTFTTADGKQTGSVYVQPGKVGDSTIVTAPNITGYTPDRTAISGTIDAHGNFVPDKPVVYTGNPVNNQTVNIPGTKDGQSTPQTVTGLSGKVGDTITVDVPQIPGYTADKTNVQATINPDGSISTTETVNYTKIPSHTNIVEPVVDPGKGNTTVEKKPLNVSTYYNKPNVQIYALDDKSAMQSLGERELPNGTNWYSDQMVNIDGVNYYRVATNEYVKATQVYPYESVELTIETHDLEDKPLYDAAGQLVETRKLAAISDWFTDRLITINGEKYYRVSSGEFVKASQVNPYKEVHANIQTNSTTEYKQLYNSRGVAIPGKVVAANSAWYTDRVVYINGVKYYRVATDEYIKADDVDTNIDVNITEL